MSLPVLIFFLVLISCCTFSFVCSEPFICFSGSPLILALQVFLHWTELRKSFIRPSCSLTVAKSHTKTKHIIHVINKILIPLLKACTQKFSQCWSEPELTLEIPTNVCRDYPLAAYTWHLTLEVFWLLVNLPWLQKCNLISLRPDSMCYIHQWLSTMEDFASANPGGHLAISRDIVSCHNWRVVSRGYRPKLRSDLHPFHCQISGPNVNSAEVEKLCSRYSNM